MAGRTSVGVGWGIAFTVVSVLSLTLFVTSVIFYSQKKQAVGKLTELQGTMDKFVREGERERDDVKQLLASAGDKSLVSSLVETQSHLMSLATGSPKTSAADFESATEKFTGGKSPNLFAAIRDRDLQISTLTKRATDAEAARQAAQTAQNAEVARVSTLEENQKQTIDALKSQIDVYKGEVDKYADEVRAAKEEMSTHEEKVRADSSDVAVQLNARQQELERELLLSRDTVNRLQAELKGRSLKPNDEYSLVDAEIIGIDPVDNNVYLNIGPKQKARIGLSFEVYTDPTALRPDPVTGEYPSGKASIEIIKVDPGSSTARIIREKKGNPVVKGDVVANAIYDPNKVYKLLVFGNFDANLDGVATAQETSDIKALVAEWGGKTTDELAGDVDFLVLGQRPTLPPSPPQGAPVAVIDEYVRVKRLADRYDDLFRQATATSIPVLNENRLYTLIGKRLGR